MVSDSAIPPQPQAESRSWPRLLTELTQRQDLSATATQWALQQVMTDSATDAQVAALGVGMKMKGVTGVELQAAADTMLSFALRVSVPPGAVDIVGTGGDQAHTVNISTMASVVVAAAGVPVVKHGSRAASSKSGGADVLEALGVTIGVSPEAVAQSVVSNGIGFCFAPVHHPALRYAAAARRQLGIPTFFNMLGPLTNPAQPAAGLIGCAFPEGLAPMAEVFAARGDSVLLVRGGDGLDELTIDGESQVFVIADGRIAETSLRPEAVGLTSAPLASLRGGDARYNAEVARAVLGGRPGPVRQAVLLNAGAALAAHAGRLTTEGLAEQVRLGVERAAAAIDSGEAAALLDRWIAWEPAATEVAG